MWTFDEHLKAQARTWLEGGRRPEDLLTGYDYFKGHLYRFTASGQRLMRQEPAVLELVEASEKVFGKSGYDQLLGERNYCESCGERYRLENCDMCTRCESLICYRCASRLGTSELGDRQCACGGVVVG